MPDYEIKEWNESNFDVDSIPYTHDAYRQGKYAYVSDYARFWILYQYGGIYFDTDVEVIKSFDDIISTGAFMGIEKALDSVYVNPGLGLGVEAQSRICYEILNLYTEKFESSKYGIVVKLTTDTLLRHGLELADKKQTVSDITIYPNEYFNPLEDATGRLSTTENTHSIHWYTKTWADNYGPTRIWFTRLLHRCVGVNTFSKLKSIIKR
jgi:mannosyltransferase OCH1-like enzyme